MSWNAFLASSALLHDLHSKTVTPNDKEKPFTTPERPNEKNAYWLELGLLLLEYLRDQEETHNLSTVLISDFYHHLQRLHPKITLEDIRFVVAILSSSRAVAFLNTDSKLVTEEDTALLYRPPNSLKLVGLSPSGRKAIGFSKTVVDGRFTDHSAQKLHVLIEDHEFAEALKECQGLSNSMRELGQDITRVLESAGSDDLRQKYERHGPRYEVAIKRSGEIIRSASSIIQRFLSDDDLIAKFEDELFELERSISSLDSATERIRRLFMDMLGKLNNHELTYSGCFRFDVLMSSLLSETLISSSDVENIADYICPPKKEETAFEATLLKGTVRPKLIRMETEGFVLPEIEETDPIPVWVRELFKKHRDFLKERLTEAPISLAEVLSSRELSPKNMKEAITLIGASLSISNEFQNVFFSLSKQRRKIESDDFTITYDDILIHEVPNDT